MFVKYIMVLTDGMVIIIRVCTCDDVGGRRLFWSRLTSIMCFHLWNLSVATVLQCLVVYRGHVCNNCHVGGKHIFCVRITPTSSCYVAPPTGAVPFGLRVSGTWARKVSVAVPVAGAPLTFLCPRWCQSAWLAGTGSGRLYLGERVVSVVFNA